MIRLSALLCLLLPAALPAVAEDAFQRTEDHPRCANYTETRQPLFGQLHLHTQYSSDAAILATRNTPADAYRFAKGEKVGLAPFYDTRLVRVNDSQPPVGGVARHPYCLPSEMPPEGCQFTASREIQLPEGRALDFTAVTDHSEYLGETNICFFEGGAACQNPGQSQGCDTGQVCGSGLTCVPIGYDSLSCVEARGNISRLNNGIGAAQYVNVWQNPEPPNPPFQFCNETIDSAGTTTCVFQARNVWQQTIAAAEDAYDKTDQCTFTSFIAYEYTSMPQMSQCTVTYEACLDTADCNQKVCPRNNPQCNTCLPPGQCSSPPGKLCFVGANDTPCNDGATCIANGGGNNLHRNIIFRNANVPDRPISYVDVPTGCGAGAACQAYNQSDPDTAGPLATQSGTALGSPTVMLETLEGECNAKDPKKPCDFLSIPHNSNLSGGAMFILPETERDAEVRHDRERLVEIFQIKGDSECRYSEKHADAWQPGAFAADELCSFEDMSFATLAAAMLVDPDERSIPASSYVRNALKSGLQYQRENGINPFKLGFVGSLDNHNGTPTASEVDYSKYGAHGDNSFAANGQMLVETFFLGLETNGGGLTVAWAEENTRDSIFEAFERRETYATSGTRPIVRFFGGFDMPDDMCETGDFAARGYHHGQPMGGTLTPAHRTPANNVPKFAVSALMDPGWEGHPGATLQRIQIVKGWVDAGGEVRERVYDVAGSSELAPVDLETCTPANLSSSGRAHLCTVWEDPEFDPELNAFYYARVLENPSCRWNQYYCLDRGVDCSKPSRTGKDVVGYDSYEYEVCCGNKVPQDVQQRAWTSPIWYEP